MNWTFFTIVFTWLFITVIDSLLGDFFNFNISISFYLPLVVFVSKNPLLCLE